MSWKCPFSVSVVFLNFCQLYFSTASARITPVRLLRQGPIWSHNRGEGWWGSLEMSDKQHCGFGTDRLFDENRLPHTKLQPLLLRRKRWFEERIWAQYMMKPKEEISGFNFDLIRLCNKCHNYAMGSFVLDSGEQVMTTFLVGLAHLYRRLEL